MQTMYEEITTSCISEFLRVYFGVSNLTVEQITFTTLKPGLISGLSGGLHRLQLLYEKKLSDEWPDSIVLKANPDDKTTYANMLQGVKNKGLAELVPLMPNLGFNHRELMTYLNFGISFRWFIPQLYHYVANEQHGKLWLFLEDIGSYELIENWNDLAGWNKPALLRFTKGLAEFHSICWGKSEAFASQDWILKSDPSSWTEYVEAALDANKKAHPSYITSSRVSLLKRVISAYPHITEELSKQPHTVIHGDCTPRNVCFRPLAQGSHLLLYDWALTAIRPPQLDLAKFLLYVITPDSERLAIAYFVDAYLNALPEKIRESIDTSDFHFGFNLACIYYLTVYLTVCAWRAETDENQWLFREFENRLRFAELYVDKMGM